MGALQAETPCLAKKALGHPMSSISRYPLPPLTLGARAASIRTVHTRGSTHDHSWCGAIASQISPLRIALSGTATGLSPLVVVIASPSSGTPSLPRHYPVSSLL